MAEQTTGRIEDTVTSWEGVTTAPGRFGSTRFMVGRRELGHMHGESVLDMPLRHDVKDRLIGEGRVSEHRYAPAGSGWVTFRLEEDGDIELAIELLREQYERATA